MKGRNSSVPRSPFPIPCSLLPAQDCNLEWYLGLKVLRKAPSAGCGVSLTNNEQQTTNNEQQTTNNKQQTTNNKQQTTNNK
ncbi:MAG: hypothetical protein F6K47_20820 [Symploca sp. SIO2E6]|nr:hypothetical protein [Symploca sp. SIO2E6]